jgi:hypothetical protein|tara:strand:- start:344 stop:1174 length:831 start_codon:yes stop_codon:yes gene_type:complete
MSNNKLNCDSKIQSLQDQINKQQRRLSIYQNSENLTLQNAKDVNKLIAKANESVSCGVGSDCYRQKKIDKLHDIYNSKGVNKKTAPEQLDVARKNYYTYAFGQPGYIEKETQVLTDRVDKEIVKMNNTHKLNMEEIELFDKAYLDAIGYKTNLLMYLSKLYSENTELSIEIKNSIAGLKTSDRKVWYEDDQIKTTESWVPVLTTLYWLVFAIFAGLFLWYKMWKFDKPFKYVYCVVLLLLTIWLYVSDLIVIKALQLVQKLIKYLPKNVYFDAKNM